MSTDEIQRIEDDLATMRQAVKKDKPYERADIFPHLALGVGALISGALISGALITIPMLQSRIDSRLCVLLGMAPGLVWWCVRYFQARNQRAVRPLLWAEYKWSFVALAISLPALFGWMWWSERFGASRFTVGTAMLFCVGIVSCLIGLIDPIRRLCLLPGISVIIFAVLLPTLDPKQILFAGCVLLAVCSFGGAAAIWWMTRGGSEDISQREMPNE